MEEVPGAREADQHPGGSCQDAAATAAGEVPEAERIPCFTKLVYSAPTMAMLPFVVMFSMFGNQNYEAFGAALPTISLFTALARSFDVVSDPLMSYVTDTTRTRFGRRRPFMFVGCFIYAAFLWLLMNPPYGDRNSVSTWFGSMYIMFFLANTFLTVPYYAWGPEMSTNSGERTSLFFYLSIFDGVGTLTAVGLPLIATNHVQQSRWNHWICKPDAEQAPLCLDARSCGDLGELGVGGAYAENATLAAQLAGSATELGWLDGVDITTVCSDWLQDQGLKVLGNASTARQNTAFCECMAGCDGACESADARTAFSIVGYIFAVWCIASILACVWLVKERPRQEGAPPPPQFVPAMLNTMMNGPFRILLPAWACDAFCTATVQSMMPYFVIVITQPTYQTEAVHGHDCGNPESETYSSIYCETQNVIAVAGVAVILSAILALPLWNLAARKFGKVRAWLLWSVSMAFTNFLFLIIGPHAFNSITALWVVAALNGVPIGAKFLADSILGDIIDYDEFLTGQRNEATYMMFKSFLPKIVQIPATAVPVALLQPVGYRSPVGGVEQPQPASAQVFMMCVTLSACIMSIVSTCIKRRYPLSTEKHLQEIRAGVEEHGRGRAYPDPVTGTEYKPVRVGGEMQAIYSLLDHFRQGRLRREFIEAGDRHLVPLILQVQGRSVALEGEGVELEKAIHIELGSESIVQTMNAQLVVASICFVASCTATALSLRLLDYSAWQWVPTFLAVGVGVSAVGLLLAVYRKIAANKLRVHAQKGDLTAYMVAQVLLHRDLLSRVGMENNSNNSTPNQVGKETGSSNSTPRQVGTPNQVGKATPASGHCTVSR